MAYTLIYWGVLTALDIGLAVLHCAAERAAADEAAERAAAKEAAEKRAAERAAERAAQGLAPLEADRRVIVPITYKDAETVETIMSTEKRQELLARIATSGAKMTAFEARPTARARAWRNFKTFGFPLYLTLTIAGLAVVIAGAAVQFALLIVHHLLLCLPQSIYGALVPESRRPSSYIWDRIPRFLELFQDAHDVEKGLLEEIDAAIIANANPSYSPAVSSPAAAASWPTEAAPLPSLPQAAPLPLELVPVMAGPSGSLLLNAAAGSLLLPGDELRGRLDGLAVAPLERLATFRLRCSERVAVDHKSSQEENFVWHAEHVHHEVIATAIVPVGASSVEFVMPPIPEGAPPSFSFPRLDSEDRQTWGFMVARIDHELSATVESARSDFKVLLRVGASARAPAGAHWPPAPAAALSEDRVQRGCSPCDSGARVDATLRLPLVVALRASGRAPGWLHPEVGLRLHEARGSPLPLGEARIELCIQQHFMGHEELIKEKLDQFKPCRYIVSRSSLPRSLIAAASAEGPLERVSLDIPDRLRHFDEDGDFSHTSPLFDAVCCGEDPTLLPPSFRSAYFSANYQLIVRATNSSHAVVDFLSVTDESPKKERHEPTLRVPLWVSDNPATAAAAAAQGPLPPPTGAGKAPAPYGTPALPAAPTSGAPYGAPTFGAPYVAPYGTLSAEAPRALLVAPYGAFDAAAPAADAAPPAPLPEGVAALAPAMQVMAAAPSLTPTQTPAVAASSLATTQTAAAAPSLAPTQTPAAALTPTPTLPPGWSVASSGAFVGPLGIMRVALPAALGDAASGLPPGWLVDFDGAQALYFPPQPGAPHTVERPMGEVEGQSPADAGIIAEQLVV